MSSGKSSKLDQTESGRTSLLKGSSGPAGSPCQSSPWAATFVPWRQNPGQWWGRVSQVNFSFKLYLQSSSNALLKAGAVVNSAPEIGGRFARRFEQICSQTRVGLHLVHFCRFQGCLQGAWCSFERWPQASRRGQFSEIRNWFQIDGNRWKCCGKSSGRGRRRQWSQYWAGLRWQRTVLSDI